MSALAQAGAQVRRRGWVPACAATLLWLLVGGDPACAQAPVDRRSPNEIVAAAPAADWVEIAASDLLVMDLAPDAGGKARRVVIQLMPPPFSQGWVGNIRKLVAARWYDGTSINRVQDNYVVQWGDPNSDDKAKAKPLPGGLRNVGQENYQVRRKDFERFTEINVASLDQFVQWAANADRLGHLAQDGSASAKFPNGWHERDSYAAWVEIFRGGWAMASDGARETVNDDSKFWPVHCYGMVGVGRDMPPDTGTGAELYAVIGQAPRHLDRNIALVGRVVQGIEQLSSLPRGTGELGFYKIAAERVPILRVRLASELPAGERPRLQYLSTESESFARYADARANRRDAFFIQPAGGADICNIPVPVREVK